jgi:hypothetical protein
MPPHPERPPRSSECHVHPAHVRHEAHPPFGRRPDAAENDDVPLLPLVRVHGVDGDGGPLLGNVSHNGVEGAFQCGGLLLVRSDGTHLRRAREEKVGR